MSRRDAKTIALSAAVLAGFVACGTLGFVACGAFAGENGSDTSNDKDASANDVVSSLDAGAGVDASISSAGDSAADADADDAGTDAGADAFVPPCPPSFVEPSAIALCLASSGTGYCKFFIDGGASGCTTDDACRVQSLACAQPSDCNGDVCCGQIFPSDPAACPASGSINQSFCVKPHTCTQDVLCSSDADCTVGTCHAFDVTIASESVEIGFCQ